MKLRGEAMPRLRSFCRGLSVFSWLLRQSHLLTPQSCVNSRWRANFSALFFCAFLFGALCFSAGKKERSDAYVQRKQDPKP